MISKGRGKGDRKSCKRWGWSRAGELTRWRETRRERFVKWIKLQEPKALEAKAWGRGRALKDTAAELAGA